MKALYLVGLFILALITAQFFDKKEQPQLITKIKTYINEHKPNQPKRDIAISDEVIVDFSSQGTYMVDNEKKGEKIHILLKGLVDGQTYYLRLRPSKIPQTVIFNAERPIDVITRSPASEDKPNFYYSPANRPTEEYKETMYTMMVLKNSIYISRVSF